MHSLCYEKKIITYHHNLGNEQQDQNTLSFLQASLSYLGTT